MKKPLSILLALIMCVSMCACEYEREKIEKTLPETTWTNANTYPLTYSVYDFQNDGHLYIDEYSRWSGKEEILRSKNEADHDLRERRKEVSRLERKVV